MGVALGSITLSPASLCVTLVLWMYSLYIPLAPKVRLKLCLSLGHCTVSIIAVI